MTVVVAVVSPTGAWIGADSLASDSDTGQATISRTPKIAKFGNLLVGFAGSWGIGKLIFEQLQSSQSPSPQRFLQHFTPEKLEPYKASSENDWCLLMVYDRRVFEIGNDFSCVEVQKNKGYAYNAIGSGASIALGALWLDHEDDGSVIHALEASETHSIFVRKPFLIIGE